MPADADRFLKIPEAAALLQVSERTLRQWVYDGTLEAVRVGYVIRVPASSIARLIGPARRTPATPPEKVTP